MKKGEKRKRGWLEGVGAAVIVVVAAALVLAGCGREDPPEPTTPPTLTESTNPPNPTDPPDSTEPSETTNPWPDEDVEPETGIAVETRYITFTYPSEWKGKVDVLQSTEGRNHVVTFQTEVADRKVELFSLILGMDAAKGYLLGQLEDSDAGTINVICAMGQINAADWTEEEYTDLCNMQERVNDILAQVQQDLRFTNGE